jgi:hypothetical protein
LASEVTTKEADPGPIPGLSLLRQALGRRGFGGQAEAGYNNAIPGVGAPGYNTAIPGVGAPGYNTAIPGVGAPGYNWGWSAAPPAPKGEACHDGMDGVEGQVEGEEGRGGGEETGDLRAET